MPFKDLGVMVTKMSLKPAKQLLPAFQIYSPSLGEFQFCPFWDLRHSGTSLLSTSPESQRMTGGLQDLFNEGLSEEKQF